MFYSEEPVTETFSDTIAQPISFVSIYLKGKGCQAVQASIQTRTGHGVFLEIALVRQCIGVVVAT